MLNELTTTAGETLRGMPWQVHPHPQMKREDWLNLNGAWDFSVDYEKKGSIRVPFCPESKLSGIGAHFDEGSILCYTRNFRLPEGWGKGRVILHIGARMSSLTASLPAPTRAVMRHSLLILQVSWKRRTHCRSAVLTICRISPTLTASRP